MKSLVLYESQFGNTQKVAEAIAEVIEGTVVPVADFTPAMLDGVDLLVVGSPIHGWQPSDETNAFMLHLEKNELKDKFVAAFDTGFKSWLAGNAADRILKALKKAGGRPLIPTHKFVVEHKEGPLATDELDRANVWAHDLKNQFEKFSGQNLVTI